MDETFYHRFDGQALIGLNLRSIIQLSPVVATNGYAAIATALAISIATAVILWPVALQAIGLSLFCYQTASIKLRLT